MIFENTLLLPESLGKMYFSISLKYFSVEVFLVEYFSPYLSATATIVSNSSLSPSPLVATVNTTGTPRRFSNFFLLIFIPSFSALST